jgi:hypothetical protein
MSGETRYPNPEVMPEPGGKPGMSMGVVKWPDGHYSIGWSRMSKEQVRAFGRQLLEITGPEEGEPA